VEFSKFILEGSSVLKMPVVTFFIVAHFVAVGTSWQLLVKMSGRTEMQYY
jgi:hypothetical protein